jgi:ABC-type Zn2+ transport system substrate-binding protein/surface adhesin
MHETPMSDHDAPADHHADSHDAGHDDHHDVGTLGPIDWSMWLVGVAGLVAAAAIVACAVLATSFTFFDLV